MNITPEIREKLREPFPDEAISQHPTKTFLSTIKAIYIVERLNDVFGIGRWNMEHEIIQDDTEYITVKGRLVINGKDGFTSPWQYGGHKKTGKNTEPADGYKSAVTDCQSKCASYLEIGIDVFKGKVKPNGNGEKVGGNQNMACPECGEGKAVIKGKEEYGGGWVCFAKKGGCGFKWQDEGNGKPAPEKSSQEAKSKPQSKKQPTIETLKKQINSEMTAKGLSTAEKKAFYAFVLSNSDSGESVAWAADFSLHFHDYFDSFIQSEVYQRDAN